MINFEQKEPDHRAASVVAQIHRHTHYAGIDPIEDAFARALLGADGVPAEVLSAAAMHYDPFHESKITPLLLAGATNKQLKAGLGLDSTVMDVYRYLFYDASVFASFLHRRKYIDTLRRASTDPDTRELLRCASEEGAECVMAIVAGGTFSISPAEMIRKQINKAYLITCKVDVADITSEFSAAAQKWALTGTKALSQLPTALDTSFTDNRDDIIFKLTQRQDKLLSTATNTSTNEPVDTALIETGQE